MKYIIIGLIGLCTFVVVYVTSFLIIRGVERDE